MGEFLDTLNPRFPEGKVESESDAIQLLCKDEYVLGLARDIVKNGINPLEVLGVIKDQKPTRDFNDQTYIVTEGNRRICALKLLHDPERAPDKQKKAFTQLSEKMEKIDTVPCIIFSNRSDSDIWLERLHGDLNGGIGRKKWTAEQKQRFSGDTRNARAQAILDYAEKTMGALSEEQRKEKLTTAQRFLSNPIVREALGVDDSSTSELLINRPKEDFEARLGQFVRDLVSGEKVHSRAKKDDFVAYARSLEQNIHVSGGRTDPELANEVKSGASANKDSKKNSRPRKTPGLRHIRHNPKITNLLRKTGNLKLESLYFGICRIELNDYFVPILTISCWALIESLSAAANRKSNTSFNSFYSSSKLNNLGLGGSSKETRPISEALSRLESLGNTSKHHFVSANFHGQQLANDMQCLEPLMIETLKEITGVQNASN